MTDNTIRIEVKPSYMRKDKGSFLIIPKRFRHLMPSKSTDLKIKGLGENNHYEVKYYRVSGVTNWYKENNVTPGTIIFLIRSKDEYELEAYSKKLDKKAITGYKEILYELFRPMPYSDMIAYDKLEGDYVNSSNIKFKDLKEEMIYLETLSYPFKFFSFKANFKILAKSSYFMKKKLRLFSVINYLVVNFVGFVLGLTFTTLLKFFTNLLKLWGILI